MAFIDLDGLTTAQAELWREVSEMNAEKPEAWLLFVNACHAMDTAKALFDLGKIDVVMQMGMPACRVRQAVPPTEVERLRSALQEITDPTVIYLTPPCSKDLDFGRMWNEDGASDCECDPPCKPTLYIRADLVTSHQPLK